MKRREKIILKIGRLKSTLFLAIIFIASSCQSNSDKSFKSDLPKTILNKVSILYYNQNYIESIKLIDSALVEHFNEPELFFWKAKNLAKINRTNAASNSYQKAIEIDSGVGKYYNNRGLLYLRLSKKDLALQDFNKAIELNDSIAFFYNNRGLYWSGVNECN